MQYLPCTHRVSAKALIKSRELLLLVKERSSFWDLPGGGVEHFESPLDALRREVEEELGSKVARIDSDSLQAWTMHDLIHDRPLIFLVYNVELEELPAMGFVLECEIGFFDRKALRSLPIEPHLEQYRQNILLALHT